MLLYRTKTIPCGSLSSQYVTVQRSTCPVQPFLGTVALNIEICPLILVEVANAYLSIFTLHIVIVAKF